MTFPSEVFALNDIFPIEPPVISLLSRAESHLSQIFLDSLKLLKVVCVQYLIVFECPNSDLDLMDQQLWKVAHELFDGELHRCVVFPFPIGKVGDREHFGLEDAIKF